MRRVFQTIQDVAVYMNRIDDSAVTARFPAQECENPVQQLAIRHAVGNIAQAGSKMYVRTEPPPQFLHRPEEDKTVVWIDRNRKDQRIQVYLREIETGF